MSALALGLVLACAAFAVLALGGCAVRWSIRRGGWMPRGARAAFAVAVLPIVLPAAIAFGVLLPSFLWHEPVRAGEWPGVILVALAIAGAGWLALVVGRAARMLWRSAALRRNWLRGAQPLPREAWGLSAWVADLEHPEVALAGILRPCLFVDRRILETCSPQELKAIAAHERAHARAFDNWSRLLVEACNGRRSPFAVAWRRAAEARADASAARADRCAVDLAAALVRVSRLIVAPRGPAAAVSAVHEGGDVQWRIRSLLSDRSGPMVRPSGLGAGALAAALAVAVLHTRELHTAMETVLHLLP